MNSNRPPFAPPAPAPQMLPASTELGPVHLNVTDAGRARAFWTRHVGLTELPPDGDDVRLGINGREMIVLHPGASGPVVPRHTGLYHVAIHLPSKKELARVVARLLALRYPNSPTDHAETMATYLSDPDGNGIELTFETPERGTLSIGDGRGIAIMANGSTQGPTEALDVESLMSDLTNEDDLMQSMPAGTRIGHVHLHVTDLDEARRFYRDIIGFGDLRAMDAWGMSDLSLKTSYVPHALAVNVWNGPGARPRPDMTAGLRYWSLLVQSTSDLDAIGARLDDAGLTFVRENHQLTIADPFSNRLVVTVR